MTLHKVSRLLDCSVVWVYNEFGALVYADLLDNFRSSDFLADNGCYHVNRIEPMAHDLHVYAYLKESVF